MGREAHHSLFSSLYFASTQVVVHKRLARRRYRVPQPEPLRRCVPSQPLLFRGRTDGFDADGECDRTPNQILSLRKTLPKTILQTSSPCGRYSRLTPPQPVDQQLVSSALCTVRAVAGRTLGRFLVHILVVYDIVPPNDGRSGPGATSKAKDPL